MSIPCKRCVTVDPSQDTSNMGIAWKKQAKDADIGKFATKKKFEKIKNGHEG